MRFGFLILAAVSAQPALAHSHHHRCDQVAAPGLSILEMAKRPGAFIEFGKKVELQPTSCLYQAFYGSLLEQDRPKAATVGDMVVFSQIQSAALEACKNPRGKPLAVRDLGALLPGARACLQKFDPLDVAMAVRPRIVASRPAKLVAGQVEKFADKTRSLANSWYWTSTPNPAPADTAVLTQHNDLARSGLNLVETTLKPSNVGPNKFGKLFSRPVDGQIYTQPLYVPSFRLPNGTVHNLVIVGTMHNSLYAFDADDAFASAPIWRTSFDSAVRLRDPNVGKGVGYMDIREEIGVLSTPVIDLANNRIYCTSMHHEGDLYQWRFHRVNLTTGEEIGLPLPLDAGAPGKGPENSKGQVVFDATKQLQRVALTLAGGLVHIGFGSLGDTDPFHGWIYTYDTRSEKLSVSLLTTPDGPEGGAGIWQSGQGFAVDENGDVYFAAGNGATSVHRGGGDLGSAIVRLRHDGTKFQIRDWFLPFNFDHLNRADLDVGSSGVMLLPPTRIYPGKRLLVGGSKEGKIYVLDRDQMGHWHAPGDSQIQQAFQGTNFGRLDKNIHGTPIYWEFEGPKGTRGWLYVMGEEDRLKAYELTAQGVFAPRPVSSSRHRAADGMPGGMLSLSASGHDPATGIVWVTRPFHGDGNMSVVPGIVQAFDASDLSRELWNSEIDPSHDSIGDFAKFASPTVANGKVYVASFSNSLAVYGLLDPNQPRKTSAPAPHPQSYPAHVH